MCECFGTTQPFFRYTCASISWSPVMRRRDSLSCSSSRGISSQRYQVDRLVITTGLHEGSSDNVGDVVDFREGVDGCLSPLGAAVFPDAPSTCSNRHRLALQHRPLSRASAGTARADIRRL